jgi:hypothetical protein
LQPGAFKIQDFKPWWQCWQAQQAAAAKEVQLTQAAWQLRDTYELFALAAAEV